MSMKKIFTILFCFASIISNAQLRGSGSGTGNIVYATSPTITTPDFTTGFKIGSAAASGKIPIGNGTNYVASTPTYPNAASTLLKWIRSDGTNFITSTSTLAEGNVTAGKALLSDGTNWVASTPTFPNASATSGKVIKSDGTNWTASTETYAAPGTSGNFLQSDGTNWTANNPRLNWTSFVVSGSNATTTGQSLVDVTGLVSGTLTNSTLYEVEAFLNCTTSAVTTGTEYGIGAGGTGGAAVVVALLTGSSTSATAVSNQGLAASATASTAMLTTSGQSGFIYIHGWVTTRGSGTATISIQHLKVTSGTSTVLIGSWFRYRLAN